MIQSIERFLQRIGILPPFDENDVLNASIEDKARDNEKVVERLKTSLSRRHEANFRLRTALNIAKRRTTSFEEFERMISGRTSGNDDA